MLRTVDVERLIEDDHSVRSIWDLVGRLDLSLYHAQIEAVEGHAGRDHTDPQLLISLWLYAYSRGISSARWLRNLFRYLRGTISTESRHVGKRSLQVGHPFENSQITGKP